MKKYVALLAAATLLAFVFSCRKEKGWEPLFNGKNLDNWDTYIGSPLRGQDSLSRESMAGKVFSVVEKEGIPVIRITGEVNGSLATRESFGDYHLRLVFKWGDSVFSNRNSGLLYHSTGSFGAAFGTWMTNIECQLMHGNLGDTYLMNNTVCETAAVKEDSTGNFRFTPGVPPISFGELDNGRSVKKGRDAENPAGEWNTVELYTVGQTAVHVVNGTTVMVNQRTGLRNGDETLPLVSGKIQLQSEGAELYVRSVDIRPIRRLPPDILP